jgi:HSP20 family molecular chaperone IbpA
MAVMRLVGAGRRAPFHAWVSEGADDYVVALDVSEFTERDLAVEVLGHVVFVRGDQQETEGDTLEPFRLHERLEESFRLPDDADVERTRAFYRRGTIEIQVPRAELRPRPVEIEPRPYGVNPDAQPI